MTGKRCDHLVVFYSKIAKSFCKYFSARYILFDIMYATNCSSINDEWLVLINEMIHIEKKIIKIIANSLEITPYYALQNKC